MSKQIDFFPKAIYDFILIAYKGNDLSMQDSDLQICVNIFKVMKTLKTHHLSPMRRKETSALFRKHSLNS